MDRRAVSAMPDDVDEELAERLQEFVYGTITMLVVIGALDDKNLGSPRDATFVIVGTTFATWLAHTFAAIIGMHIHERRSVRRHEVITNFRRSWRIITAGAARDRSRAARRPRRHLTAVRALVATLVGVIPARLGRHLRRPPFTVDVLRRRCLCRDGGDHRARDRRDRARRLPLTLNRLNRGRVRPRHAIAESPTRPSVRRCYGRRSGPGRRT